jgi:hypothetical protein
MQDCSIRNWTVYGINPSATRETRDSAKIGSKRAGCDARNCLEKIRKGERGNFRYPKRRGTSYRIALESEANPGIPSARIPLSTPRKAASTASARKPVSSARWPSRASSPTIEGNLESGIGHDSRRHSRRGPALGSLTPIGALVPNRLSPHLERKPKTLSAVLHMSCNTPGIL